MLERYTDQISRLDSQPPAGGTDIRAVEHLEDTGRIQLERRWPEEEVEAPVPVVVRITIATRIQISNEELRLPWQVKGISHLYGLHVGERLEPWPTLN